MTASLHTLAFLQNIGPLEATLIFVAILLLFGAKKLPELARGLGKSMNEFKRAREDFEMEIKRGEIESDKDLKKAKDTDEKES